MSLNSDQPKTTKEQDALGFADSAESVAKSILDGEYPDGFVIGIEGEWGSGKTTYINLIRESLKKQSSEFKIIEFKPWLHSSQENLIAAYFKFLRENAKNIFGDDSDIKKNLASVAQSFTPLVGTLASFAGLGDIAKSGMNLMSETLKETPTLESQYEIIQEKLKESQKPFVVIIDDLDRLDRAEVKTMLKLVKSVGKLPYMIYILSYNRAYVENATDSEMPNFLEKIVQLPIPIPKPIQSKLITMLDNELQQFFKTIDGNNNRSRDIIRATLYPHIDKPRKAILLANTINFRSPAMKGKIDPVDLFSLECLRLFDKDLWDWIRGNKDIIFSNSVNNFIPNDAEKFKKDLEASLPIKIEKLSRNRKTTLSILFPRLSDSFGKDGYRTVEDYSKTRDRYGIAIESVYDTYFAQYLEDAEISKFEIDSFLKNSDDRGIATKLLQNWMAKKDAQGNSKIVAFLELLSFRFLNNQDIAPNQELLLSLCDVCHNIHSLEHVDSFPNFPPHWQLLHTFEALFERMGKQNTSAFLKKLCDDDGQHFTVIFLLYYIGIYLNKMQVRGHEDSRHVSYIEDADWEFLTDKFASSLRMIFVTGKIGTFYNVSFAEHLAGHILGGENARSMFRRGYKKSEQYTIKSVKSHLMRTPLKNGGTSFKFSPTNHPNLFDYNLITEYAEKIDLEKQDEETKQAITVFLDGVRNPLNKNPTD